MKHTTINQKGFAPILIIIPLAIIIVIGVIVYGYFITVKKPIQKTELPTFKPSSAPVRLGTPGCEDVDYTGCDTSSNFMTWHDDGQRNPPAPK